MLYDSTVTFRKSAISPSKKGFSLPTSRASSPCQKSKKIPDQNANFSQPIFVGHYRRDRFAAMRGRLLAEVDAIAAENWPVYWARC